MQLAIQWVCSWLCNTVRKFSLKFTSLFCSTFCSTLCLSRSFLQIASYHEKIILQPCNSLNVKPRASKGNFFLNNFPNLKRTKMCCKKNLERDFKIWVIQKNEKKNLEVCKQQTLRCFYLSRSVSCVSECVCLCVRERERARQSAW